MIRRSIRMPVSVCVALALALAAHALACRQAGAAELPFAATLESVIDNGRIEGHPVSIVRFRTRIPVADARDALARAWTHLPLVERESGAWRLVSAFDDGTYRTVQLRADGAGGSEGLYSVWAPESSAPALPGPDPATVLPAGATVQRRVAAIDAGRRTETVVARHADSAAATLAALDRRLAQAGFIADAVPRAGARGGLRIYRRGGREIAFTVASHDGATAIVLHITEASP